MRIAAPDGFAAEFADPAMARIVRTHPKVLLELTSPKVLLELTSATRPIVHGHGADIEIGVGSSVPRRETVTLATYHLGLYASSDYLADRRAPITIAELSSRRLIRAREPELLGRSSPVG